MEGLEIMADQGTCHGSHGDPGTRRRGCKQTGYLMSNRRRRHRNTGKNIDTLTLTIIHSNMGQNRLDIGRHDWKHLGHNQDTDED